MERSKYPTVPEVLGMHCLTRHPSRRRTHIEGLHSGFRLWDPA